MKIEIQDKELSESLELLSETNYKEVGQFIKDILQDYVKANCKEDYSKIDTSVSKIKSEAEKLGKNISNTIHNFEKYYGVKARLEKGEGVTYISGNHLTNWLVKVELN